MKKTDFQQMVLGNQVRMANALENIAEQLSDIEKAFGEVIEVMEMLIKNIKTVPADKEDAKKE